MKTLYKFMQFKVHHHQISPNLSDVAEVQYKL